MATGPLPATRVADRLLGVAALVTAVVVVRAGFARQLRVLQTLDRWLRPRHASSSTAAERALAGVRWAAAWWPGRAACLEESVATKLALLARRRAVTWCLGVRTQPTALHAWTQVGDVTIGEPGASEGFTVLYRI